MWKWSQCHSFQWKHASSAHIIFSTHFWVCLHHFLIYIIHLVNKMLSVLVWNDLIVNVWPNVVFSVLSRSWKINMFVLCPFLPPNCLALLHSLSLSICRSSLKTLWFRRPPKLLKPDAFSFRLSSVPMILLLRVHAVPVCVCLTLTLTCSLPKHIQSVSHVFIPQLWFLIQPIIFFYREVFICSNAILIKVCKGLMSLKRM